MRLILFILGLAAMAVLAGCEDMDRPLNYNKGEYAGQPDTKLTAEQVETLRQRGMRTYQ